METLLPLLLLLGQKCGVAPTHPFGKEVIGHSFNLVLFELAAIMKSYRGDPFTKFTRKEDLLMGFIKLLTKHVKEQRSVQYYADQLFITPKHLSRTIKELTGKTCGELIDEMVITEAKVLLNDSALSIGNVAEELHFSDQFFFSKFFKHHTGLTPTEYRTSV